MASTLPAPRVTRVVLAIDASAQSLLALETGVELASAVGASLEGLFFEDVDLVRLGALPFAFEVNALTGRSQEISSEQVERALRLEAERQQKRLATAAARTRVSWSFSVARGQRLTQALAREADLVVLASRARTKALKRTPGPVSVLFDESDASMHILSAAARLAATLARDLLILVPDLAAQSMRTWRESAQAWLASEKVRGQLVQLAPDQAALVAAVRDQRCGTLVLPASAMKAWSIDVDFVLAELNCPLVLAR